MRVLPLCVSIGITMSAVAAVFAALESWPEAAGAFAVANVFGWLADLIRDLEDR